MDPSPMKILKVDRKIYEVIQDSSGKWYKRRRHPSGVFCVPVDTDNHLLYLFEDKYDARCRGSNAWATKSRLRIIYGDTKTGKPWGDIDVGYVGKSTGDIPIPLLVKKSSSRGGSAILVTSIVAVTKSQKDKRSGWYPALWTHAKWKSEYDDPPEPYGDGASVTEHILGRRIKS